MLTIIKVSIIDEIYKNKIIIPPNITRTKIHEIHESFKRKKSKKDIMIVNRITIKLIKIGEFEK